MSMVTLNLKDDSQVDYADLLRQLIEKGRKPGEKFNVSEYVRKLLLREAKKAGLL